MYLTCFAFLLECCEQWETKKRRTARHKEVKELEIEKGEEGARARFNKPTHKNEEKARLLSELRKSTPEYANIQTWKREFGSEISHARV